MVELAKRHADRSRDLERNSPTRAWIGKRLSEEMSRRQTRPVSLEIGVQVLAAEVR
jgi:hypothetical protein